MKLALVSDIHANLAAFQAVIRDAPSVDGWLCAGDSVGYYAQPNEVCQLLQSLRAFVVRGNHDAYVTGQIEPNSERRAAYRTDWTRDTLTPEVLRWLTCLPVEMRFVMAGRPIRLRHASPWDEHTYLYPDSPRITDVVLQGEEILIVGHTHYPLVRHVTGGLLVNPGSVGQPRDRNPLASYALLEIESGQVEHRRVAYAVSEVQDDLNRQGWDPKMVAILSRTN